MERIAIVIPYFGVLPSNFVTFLRSCELNPTIDWYIFTDSSTNRVNIPNNVQIIETTFQNIKKRIIKIVGVNNFSLDSPYKLVDYKPLFGLIFADYLHSYDYWGYSDMDVIYGDIRKFIKKGLENKLDKIGELGHFTLFKNNDEVNNRYRLKIRNNSLFLAASHMSTISHFDEGGGINKIYEFYGYKTYKNKDLVNEICVENKDLCTYDKRYIKLPSVYVWHEGKCLFFYILNGKIEKHEFGYFHFQKRKFTEFIKEPVNSLYVCTDGYHILPKFNSFYIKKAISRNHSPFFARVRYLCNSYFLTNNFTERKIGCFYLPIEHIRNHVFSKNFFF